MKRYCFLFASLILACTYGAKSQQDPWYKFYNTDNPCEPCKDPLLTQNPNLNWDSLPNMNHNVTIGKCLYTITYKKRKCNFWDLKISSITPVTPNCSTPATDKSGNTLSLCEQIKLYTNLYNELIKQLCFDNPMNFTTGMPGGQVDVWRVLRPKCIRITSGSFSASETDKCQPGCCLNFVVIARDTCNNVTANDWKQLEEGDECGIAGSGSPDCTNAIIGPNDLCIPVCDKLKFLTNFNRTY